MPTDEQIAADPYLADRYGVPSAWSRWLGMVIVGLVVAAGVGGFLYLGYKTSNPAVNAVITRFDVPTAHEADITVEVHKSPSTTGECILRVSDRNGADVARELVTFRPAKSHVTTHQVRVTTSARAHGAEIIDCRRVNTPRALLASWAEG